jgi:secreted Zn-dependent insulinase-like peptidase
LALEDIIEEYENFYCEEADEISDDTLDLILNEGYPSIEQIKQGLEELEYDDVQSRARKFWEKAKVVWIVVGNFQEQTVVDAI